MVLVLRVSFARIVSEEVSFLSHNLDFGAFFMVLGEMVGSSLAGSVPAVHIHS